MEQGLLTSEWFPCFFLASVGPLPVGEGEVSVLDHMLDLSFHGDAEEHDEVHDQDGPEHGHIEGFEERAYHGDNNAFRR